MLFRPEVVEARRSSGLSEVRLTQPASFSFISASVLALALGIIGLLTFASYTKRWRVDGQLIPAGGIITISAPIAGTLTRLKAREGDAILLKDVVAVVETPIATSITQDTGAALELQMQQRRAGADGAQKAQLDSLSAEAKSTSLQLELARRELLYIEDQIGAKRAQIVLARESLSKLRELQRDKYVSELQVRQQEDLALGKEGDLQSLNREADAARRAIAQLEQIIQRTRAETRIGEAKLKETLAELEQERLQNHTQREVALVSPVTGTVATQIANVGQTVQVGQAIATIVPGEGKLVAQILVPSQAMRSVTPNARVVIRYRAYPYQQFGHAIGKISMISNSALTTLEQSTLTGTESSGEQRYRVLIELEQQTVDVGGRQEPLKSGMTFEADILGERRRLISWLADPLSSMKSRIVSP